MSATLPERVDAGRMVAARREFHGVLPVAALPRLRDAVADAGGEVEYALEFGRDSLGTDYLALHARARLGLQCQRTLEVFEHPVEVDVRLGLIEHERDEAGLSPGYEPLLLDNGVLEPARAIEDELLLALPPFPVKPGSEPAGQERETPQAVCRGEDHPFAALEKWKRDRP